MNGTEDLKVIGYDGVFCIVTCNYSEVSGSYQTFKKAQAVLDSWRNAGDENIKDMVFKLANKLALAGEGDAAVSMHRIHNILKI